jgi:hypothetical protein
MPKTPTKREQQREYAALSLAINTATMATAQIEDRRYRSSIVPDLQELRAQPVVGRFRR